MNILVTGGLGYIGSHTCIALLQRSGYRIIIADNLSNSSIEVLDTIKRVTGKDITFYNIDVTDEAAVEQIFAEHFLDGIMHFAGYKAVKESMEKPIKYYYNNIVSTLVLVKACMKYGVYKFIFSSSATVYGENKIPYVETMDLLKSTNPYGETKAISEKILSDTTKSNPKFAISLLRYFNPVGAHESGLLGEVPNGVPNNLMPCITQVAKGKLDKLYIFGGDYPTIDGTCIRDYIHVMDLAEGHVVALEKLSFGIHVYNLGTGRGISVLQLVDAFEGVNGIQIPHEIVQRRPGDIAEYYADTTKAQTELNWRAKRNVADMCRDAWRFEKLHCFSDFK